MVNLRYHIVSLVGVFLALAIGVVLGAGPLQNQINAISEGTNVTERANQLEAELTLSQQTETQQNTYIDDLGTSIISGTLGEKTIAFVALPGVDSALLSELSAQFENAGAKVVGTVQLTEHWTDYSEREYRGTLATPVSSHLSETDAGGTSDDVLAQALVEVLTSEGSEQTLVKEILSDKQTPLVQAESFPTEVANSVVLVGPATQVQSDSSNEASQSGDTENSKEAIISLAKKVVNAPAGGIAVGSAASDTSFITVIRNANVAVTTVDQAGTAMAAVNSVLALASGEVGAYGQEEGAKTAVAPLP